MNKLANILILVCPSVFIAVCLCTMLQINDTMFKYCMAGFILMMTVLMSVVIFNYRILIYSLDKLYENTEQESDKAIRRR